MKIIKFTALAAFIIILIFVNFNKETPLWDLMYYNQWYLFVVFFTYLGWKLETNIIIRSIIISIAFYYAFELFIDVLRIFNNILADKWYTTRVINYVLSISLGLSLLIYPIFKAIKK